VLPLSPLIIVKEHTALCAGSRTHASVEHKSQTQISSIKIPCLTSEREDWRKKDDNIANGRSLQYSAFTEEFKNLIH
jgi:hypothetical protein